MTDFLITSLSCSTTDYVPRAVVIESFSSMTKLMIVPMSISIDIGIDRIDESVSSQFNFDS